MRGVFKLVLAAMLAGAFVLATGVAFAQEKPNMSVTGWIGSAFGQYTYDKTSNAATPNANQKAFSEWETSYESNIAAVWDSEKFQALVRYRFRGSSGGAGNACAANPAAGPSCSAAIATTTSGATPETDVYHEGWWKISPQFKLGIGKFVGQAWSQPQSATYLVVNPIEIGSSANSEYWMNWTGKPGIDAEYNGGAWQAGVAISSLCVPSCNAGANQSTQSLTPHFTGTFGDISVRAQLPQTSGTIASTTTTTTTSVSGAGYQVGVKWAGMPGVAVALDLQSFVDAKLTTQNSDRTKNGTALRVDFANITVAYFDIQDNGFTATTGDSSVITLRYTIALPFGVVVPEYRSASWDGKGFDTYNAAPSQTGGGTSAVNVNGLSRSNTEFRLIYRADF